MAFQASRPYILSDICSLSLLPRLNTTTRHTALLHLIHCSPATQHFCRRSTHSSFASTYHSKLYETLPTGAPSVYSQLQLHQPGLLTVNPSVQEVCCHCENAFSKLNMYGRALCLPDPGFGALKSIAQVPVFGDLVLNLQPS
jgi:hypothetical protein